VKLANHYLDFGDNIKEAEDIYQRSFFDNLDKEITSGHADYVDIINHLAELYVSTDRYERASETLDLALDATRAKYDNQDPDYAIALDKIANLQIKIGKYEKATENNKIALDILDDQKGKKEDIDYSKALETQAKIYAINGEFDKAEDALNKSRKIASKTTLKERAGATSPVEDMAKLYIAIGEYSKTEKLLNKAVSVYEIDYGLGL